MDAETCRKMVKDLDKFAEFRRAAVEFGTAIQNLDMFNSTEWRELMRRKGRELIELESRL